MEAIENPSDTPTSEQNLVTEKDAATNGAEHEEEDGGEAGGEGKICWQFEFYTIMLMWDFKVFQLTVVLPREPHKIQIIVSGSPILIGEHPG